MKEELLKSSAVQSVQSNIIKKPDIVTLVSQNSEEANSSWQIFFYNSGFTLYLKLFIYI